MWNIVSEISSPRKTCRATLFLQRSVMVRGAELIGDSLDLKETGEHSEEFTKGTKRPIISAGFSPPASFLRASMSALRERTSDLTSAHPFAKHRKSDAAQGRDAQGYRFRVRCSCELCFPHYRETQLVHRGSVNVSMFCSFAHSRCISEATTQHRQQPH